MAVRELDGVDGAQGEAVETATMGADRSVLSRPPRARLVAQALAVAEMGDDPDSVTDEAPEAIELLAAVLRDPRLAVAYLEARRACQRLRDVELPTKLGQYIERHDAVATAWARCCDAADEFEGFEFEDSGEE